MIYHRSTRFCVVYVLFFLDHYYFSGLQNKELLAICHVIWELLLKQLTFSRGWLIKRSTWHVRIWISVQRQWWRIPQWLQLVLLWETFTQIAFHWPQTCPNSVNGELCCWNMFQLFIIKSHNQTISNGI